MKEVRPGVWIDDEFHFKITDEDQKEIDKVNEETHEIIKKFLTELKESGRIPLIISKE